MAGIYVNDIKVRKLAAKIEGVILQRGMNRTQFAELMGKQTNEITKWFSGYYNFPVYLLFQIEEKLNISIVDIS